MNLTDDKPKVLYNRNIKLTYGSIRGIISGSI